MPQVAAPILAGGRGERMRPPTDRCPKSLLAVRGKRLIEWDPESLARAGVCDVVLRVATGDMFLPGFDFDVAHAGRSATTRWHCPWTGVGTPERLAALNLESP